MFYSFQSLQSERKTILGRVNLVAELCKEEEYLNCYDVIEHFSMLISRIPLVQVEAEDIDATRTIKSVFNISYLSRIAFPQNTLMNNVYIFFQKIKTLYLIFDFLYGRDSAELFWMATFYDKLKDFWSSIICLSCKRNCESVLRELYVLKQIAGGRYQQSIQFMFGELESRLLFCKSQRFEN